MEFIPNILNKPCINHIDWNWLNNNLNNLEWCTHSENELHSYKILWKHTWNKWKSTPKEYLEKQLKTKKEIYLKKCIRTFFLYYNWMKQKLISKKLWICTRQIIDRIKYYRLLFPNYKKILWQ